MHRAIIIYNNYYLFTVWATIFIDVLMTAFVQGVRANNFYHSYYKSNNKVYIMFIVESISCTAHAPLQWHCNSDHSFNLPSLTWNQIELLIEKRVWFQYLPTATCMCWYRFYLYAEMLMKQTAAAFHWEITLWYSYNYKN